MENDRLIYTESRGLFRPKEWIVALDLKTGNKAWDLKVGQSLIPWVQSGKVYGNAEEALIALDLLTGKTLWTQKLAEAPRLPLALSGDSLYAVVGSGKETHLKALKAADGSIAWETSCPDPEPFGMLLPTEQGFLFPKADRSLALLK